MVQCLRGLIGGPVRSIASRRSNPTDSMDLQVEGMDYSPDYSLDNGTDPYEAQESAQAVDPPRFGTPPTADQECDPRRTDRRGGRHGQQAVGPGAASGPSLCRVPWIASTGSHKVRLAMAVMHAMARG
jgi:hypothetical protein